MLKLTCDKVGLVVLMKVWFDMKPIENVGNEVPGGKEGNSKAKTETSSKLSNKGDDWVNLHLKYLKHCKNCKCCSLSLFIKKSDNVCYDCCKVWWWGHPTSSSVSTRTSVEAMLNPQLKPSLFKFLIRQQNSLKIVIVIIVIVIVITIILEHQSRAPPTLRTANNLILFERARHLTYFKERVLIWW